MGSSTIIRTCRALGAGKFPSIRVLPSLVNMPLPNRGVGHSGTTGAGGKISDHPSNKEVPG